MQHRPHITPLEPSLALLVLQQNHLVPLLCQRMVHHQRIILIQQALHTLGLLPVLSTMFSAFQAHMVCLVQCLLTQVCQLCLGCPEHQECQWNLLGLVLQHLEALCMGVRSPRFGKAQSLMRFSHSLM